MPRPRPAVRAILASLALAAAAAPLRAEKVGEVGVDWLGNDIVVESLADPKVQGVTCHIAYFDRGLIDRLQQGNWFEDPSNSSISCAKTGPVTIGDIDRSRDGEEVFREGRSIVFKSLRVTRIWDEANRTLIYLSHAREVSKGSAKMSVSTVPLFE